MGGLQGAHEGADRELPRQQKRDLAIFCRKNARGKRAAGRTREINREKEIRQVIGRVKVVERTAAASCGKVGDFDER